MLAIHLHHLHYCRLPEREKYISAHLKFVQVLLVVMGDVELDRRQDAHPRIQHPIMRAGVYLDMNSISLILNWKERHDIFIHDLAYNLCFLN